jgi:very-short-patch-repair endonuclease
VLTGPFTTREALSAGITAGQLRGRRWESPFRGVHHACGGGPADLVSRCRALAKLMPDDVVLSGITVARLLGWWLPRGAECAPFDVIVPPGCIVRRDGVRASRSRLDVGDVVEYEGLRLTAGARTLADLAARWSLVDVVVMADSALRFKACTKAELALVASRVGGRGVRTLRRVAALADRRSESAMETLLRLIYVLSNQPHPTPQVNLYDQFGDFLARGDLVGPGGRTVFEYDGADHADAARHNADVRRWVSLERNGFKVYPYTALDVFRGSAQIVTDYQDALGLPRDPRAVEGWLREFERSSFANRPHQTVQ